MKNSLKILKYSLYKMLALKDQGKVKTSRTSRIKGRNTNWILIRRSYEILPLWTALCTFGFLYVYLQVSAVVHGLLFFFFVDFWMAVVPPCVYPVIIIIFPQFRLPVHFACLLFLPFFNSSILPFFSAISFNWTKLPTCVPICILIRFPSTRADSTRCPLTFPRAFDWEKRKRGEKILNSVGKLFGFPFEFEFRFVWAAKRICFTSGI